MLFAVAIAMRRLLAWWRSKLDEHGLKNTLLVVCSSTCGTIGYCYWCWFWGGHVYDVDSSGVAVVMATTIDGGMVVEVELDE